ncbi:MAG: hypothetical protein ACU85E_05535 [Gammaproteobacteria bacterium]
METGAITTNSSLTSALSSLQRNSREEQTESIDSGNAERADSVGSLNAPTDSRAEFSEIGLKLSASIRSVPDEISEPAIQDADQARQISNELNNAIQQNPGLANAAQSNLTSFAVESLLG